MGSEWFKENRDNKYFEGEEYEEGIDLEIKDGEFEWEKRGNDKEKLDEDVEEMGLISETGRGISQNENEN